MINKFFKKFKKMKDYIQWKTAVNFVEKFL